jgi:RHS repeat-associated protein
MYPDALGRTVATVEYGTNGGGTFSRPDTIPARSDTVLVSSTSFDAAGNVAETVDPSGMVTRMEYDDAGRKTAVIENVQDGSSSSSSSSSGGDGCDPSDGENRTTRFTYTPDGQQATLTAVNPRTGDQTTTWSYGTTLDDSGIASSQLLRSVAYPDSTGGSDVVSYSYNRQGERTTLTDQRGCVHTYDRDKLGRVLHDRVTTLGSGVDGAIRRLSTTYDVRGLTGTLTSWNNADVNSGDVVNQCQFAYNSFMQLIADYQSHSGSVNTSTTPKVQYGYADGSANTIRPLTLTYPNGRVVTYDYGTADGINDAISRIASLIDDDSTHLVDYSFLGLGIIVVADYSLPDVKYTLVDLSGSNDPDTGDIYGGLDRFGRVKDCRWYDYGHSTDTVRLQYGYDPSSNRLWRADLVAQSLGKDFDELYSYDGLHRLKDMGRGLLDTEHRTLNTENFTQCWSLDPTSNWHGFKEAATGGSWTLDQSRSANEVNEITDITNTTGPTWITPAYDAAGNTTTIPQPADPIQSYTGTYDAWNRQVSLTDDTTDDTVQQNRYDPRNFRVVREDYTSGTLSETRHSYFTSGWQRIEDRLGTSPDSANPERQFVWGQRYIDDLVLRDRDTNADGTLDERLYGLQDANWNMVALIDTSATAQERYLYSPFGWPTFLSGNMATIRASSAIDNGVLFTGQRFDAQTKLHLFRMRWFDAISGRFISRDPLGYPNGPNSYAGWFVPDRFDAFGLDIITVSAPSVDATLYWLNYFIPSRKRWHSRARDELYRALSTTCTSCSHCDAKPLPATCDYFRCMRQASDIASAVLSTLENNYTNIKWPTFKTDHRYGGYLCWGWAWSFFYAFNNAVGGTVVGLPSTTMSSGGCFKATIGAAKVDVGALEHVHFWLRITSVCKDAFEVYVDDNFYRKDQFVHDSAPIPNGYAIDPDLPASYPADSCTVPTPYNAQGSPIK